MKATFLTELKILCEPLILYKAHYQHVASHLAITIHTRYFCAFNFQVIIFSSVANVLV